MYEDFFGLHEKPFSIAPDPRYLFMTEQHREALAHLLYGVSDEGGFILLTGEVGTGKTTINRSLLEQLPDNVDIAFIVNPRLTVNELLESICDEFEIAYAINSSTKILVDLLNQFLLDVHAQGRNAILIIDEAQNLSDAVLEQLRLLTNLETNEKKLLQLILIGQPELNEKLDQQHLRQLAQRITARFHINPLSNQEIESYINHRLYIAGFRGELFTKAALKAIQKESRGIPRLVNILCDRSMLGAYAKGLLLIEYPVVQEASQEIRAFSTERNTDLKSSKTFLNLFSVIVITILVFLAFSSGGIAWLIDYVQSFFSVSNTTTVAALLTNVFGLV